MSVSCEDAYRKIRDFANDHTPIPWTMRVLSSAKSEFLAKLEEDLIQYVRYQLGCAPADEETCTKLCAEVFDVKRLLYLKFDTNSTYAATNPLAWYETMLEGLLSRIRDLLPQSMRNRSKDALHQMIFHHLNIGTAASLEARYKACEEFLRNPEELPGYMQELLRNEQIMGNPIEHILDEKSIHDFEELNANPNRLGLDTDVDTDRKYLAQCARICAENYYMKMCVNRKYGRRYQPIGRLSSYYCKERTFFQKVQLRCVGEKYDNFDWDLLYHYVFQNLRRYMNPDIAKKGGLYTEKGESLDKKCQFLLDIYEIYYQCYVVPETILKELPGVRDVHQTKELLDTLLQALVKKQSIGTGEPGSAQTGSAYQEYINTVCNIMQRNKIFFSGRFVSRWPEFQKAEFGGLHISDRPQRSYANGTKHYFELYPPKTMDEIYAFCLMLQLDWNGVKKITELVYRFYADVKSGAYQKWPELEKDFITTQYRKRSEKVNLSSLKAPGPNANQKRDRQIRDFFTGKYILDYAYATGPSFHAKNLIQYLNSILSGDGLPVLPIGT